jgi:hypothetical protein
MSELSGTLVADTPVARSTVPLAGEAQVFITQVVMTGMAGFGIGSGVPKLQPVLVQSGPAVLTGGTSLVGPRVQAEPAQLSEKRLTAPSGVGPSGTIDWPPPMLRPPHVRLRRVAPLMS